MLVYIFYMKDQSEPWCIVIGILVYLSYLDFGHRQLCGKKDQELTQHHTEELETLKNLLHFPEEVALRLRDCEHHLFKSIPAMFYVRQVTTDISRTAHRHHQPNVQDLIDRFNEVNTPA